MIKFITGRSGSGKSDMITREVCSLLKGSNDDVIVNDASVNDASVNDVVVNDCVVIVPEQETVVWERKFAFLLPPSSNLHLEVTNFTNLARSVFREYGGLADSIIDKGSRILIMWKAMLSVWKSLRVYNNISSHEDRSIPILLRAIDELKRNGISPDEAESALELMTNDAASAENSAISEKSGKYGSFVDRLSDAVLVYSAYNSLLHEEYIDSADVETKLAHSIASNPYFKGKSVFVDSFLSFTAGQEKILREIMRSADNFTAAVMTEARGKNDIPPQFFETNETLKKLMRTADSVGEKYDIVSLDTNMRHTNNPELAFCERNIFSGSHDKISAEQKNGAVELIRCRDKSDEARICSAAVNSFLKSGCDYSDIGIVAHDIEPYKGIIDTELRQHGFNCFISQSSGVTQNPVIKFFGYMLKIVSEGWQKQDIISLLKTGLITLTPPESEDGTTDELFPYSAELFENYINTWNLNGRNVYTGESWSMNPDGCKLEITEYGERMLALINNTRIQLTAPLDLFAEIFDNDSHSADVSVIAKAIVSAAEAYGIFDGLERICAAYTEHNMAEEAVKCRAGWRTLCEILDKAVEFLNGTEIDAKRFAGLYNRVAQSMDTGSIPSGGNEIIIGSAQGIRLEGKKYIIILGANEGEFPAETDSEKQFFSDRDRIALEQYGINLMDCSSDVLMSREYCMFYRTISAASEKVLILSEENKDVSFAVSEIREMLDTDFTYSRDIGTEYSVYDKKSAEDYLLDKGYGNHIQRESPEQSSTDNIIHSGETLYLSQTKLSTYIRCPFSYACKYEIKVKPRPQGDMTIPDIGVIIHLILQKYFSYIYSDSSDSHPAVSREELVDNITNGIKEKLKQSMGQAEGRAEYLFARIKRQVLVFIERLENEIAASGFTPVLFEQKIGRGGIKPIEFRSTDGERIIIEGIADRIDLADNDTSLLVRVVDYKTGNKSFKRDNLDNGTEIQLLIYMFSILNSPTYLSHVKTVDFGGIVYVSDNLATLSSNRNDAPDDITKTAHEKINFSGMMNSRLQTGNEDKKSKLIYIDKNELTDIRNKLFEQIKSIGDNILRKNFDLKPAIIDGIDPCGLCDNAYICRYRSSNV